MWIKKSWERRIEASPERDKKDDFQREGETLKMFKEDCQVPWKADVQTLEEVSNEGQGSKKKKEKERETLQTGCRLKNL